MSSFARALEEDAAHDLSQDISPYLSSPNGISPRGSVHSVSQHYTRVRKVSALSDFAPIMVPIKRYAFASLEYGLITLITAGVGEASEVQSERGEN